MDTFETHSSDDFSFEDILATLDSPAEIKRSASDPLFTPGSCQAVTFSHLFWEETADQYQGISSIPDHTALKTLTFDPLPSPESSGMRTDEVNTEAEQSLENYFSANVLVSKSSAYASLNYTKNVAGLMSETTKRSPIIRDNIAAERKRRQKLSQLFVALSAMLPGLKKVDKSTVLEETIKHIKHLHAEEKKLESESEMREGHSKIIVKKSRLLIDESGHGSPEDNSNHSYSGDLPEIEARISDKNILFRIHCLKHKGAVENALSEIKKHNLTVMNTSAQPYGVFALEITIIAKMEDGFCTSAEQLVRSLRSTI